MFFLFSSGCGWVDKELSQDDGVSCEASSIASEHEYVLGLLNSGEYSGPSPQPVEGGRDEGELTCSFVLEGGYDL